MQRHFTLNESVTVFGGDRLRDVTHRHIVRSTFHCTRFVRSFFKNVITIEKFDLAVLDRR